MSQIKRVAGTITCKGGSVRSLALNTSNVLKNNDLGGDNPTEKAWDFAKLVAKEFGDDFTEKDARKHFITVFALDGKSNTVTEKPHSKKNDTSSKKKKDLPEFGRKAKTILDSDSSKNEKIRDLLDLNHGISQIAKAMELKYQRVKNVKKAQGKKAN